MLPRFHDPICICLDGWLPHVFSKPAALGIGQPSQGEEMEMFVPIAFFAMIAAIVIAPAWFKNRDRQDMQATLRAAIEKGQPLPVEIVDALSKDTTKLPPTAARDLRTGVIMVAVSLGIGIFGYAFQFVGGSEEAKASFPIMGMGAVPGMIGLAFIVLSFFNKNKG
jgi:hypothetical protein